MEEPGTGSVRAAELQPVPADFTMEEGLRCEDEEIRLPGSIQQHGFLLLLDEQDQRVVAASENAADALDLPLKLLLGADLETVVDREILFAVRALKFREEAFGAVEYLGAFRVGRELCSMLIHSVGERRVLEFERLDRLVSPELTNAVITNFVGKLNKLRTEQELCQAITGQVKMLTGYNRVMLYRFDETGCGTVLTEERDDALPSYLDLRFPASDIPQQARALYLSNTMRIIPDAEYVPSPLRGVKGMDAAGLDLSLSVLRSVSPVHLEYMRNMGTLSSMSISLVCEGRLWGLISAHHATARTVPYLVRSACDMLAKMVSTQLVGLKTAARLETMVNFHAVQRQMLTQMAAESSYLEALIGRIDEMVKVTNATGVALVMDGRIVRGGVCPDEEAVGRLVDWLEAKEGMEMFETSQLGTELEWEGRLREIASGMLAIRVSDVKRNYVIWFRPEVVETVKWAGEPVKLQDGMQRLHPRFSFDSWKETVRGQSAAWTEVEIESAMDFRGALTTIGLRRAEEQVELSEARFEQLTHAMPTLVWTADDAGELTYTNRRWRDTGFAGQGLWFRVAGLAPEDEARCEKEWEKAVEGGRLFEEEVRLRRADGSERWNLVRAVPFQRAGASRAGWVGTFTDLTDRREREAALRMTEKLALSGRMTSVIAHEINNPLEAITNCLYLIEGELAGNAQAEEYIRMASGELARISGITKQTLRWGREQTERAEWVRAGVLFEEVMRLFSGKIRNRMVEVTVAAGAALEVYGVVGQVRQVVANLVSNAVDAVPVGGRVMLDAEAVEGGVELVVKDAGSGIPEEVRQQLFQPFHSTKGDLGNGLGLYISKEIVERHGGTMTVKSEVGVGTVMRVMLPSPTV